MRRVLAVLILLGLRPAWAGEIPAERQAALLNLLVQDCGSCHGLARKGGLGPPLLPENLAAKSDTYLTDTILNGRPGTAMPPWRGFFSADEAAWLVRQLRKNP